MADFAIKSALAGNSGVIGHDEDNNNRLSCINFDRIKGGNHLIYLPFGIRIC